MTMRLIYGFDPLCGWCYGFASTLRAVRTALPALRIDLRMGGLITGGRIRPYREASDYIAQAAARMQAVTGVALGEAFRTKLLKDPNVISSSLPPCDALLQIRNKAPDRVFDAAEALQIAHFRDGMDLNDQHTYAAVMHTIGLDLSLIPKAPDFISADLEQEFARSRALGLTSFPSLLIGSRGNLKAIEVSYDPDVLVDRISTELVSE